MKIYEIDTSSPIMREAIEAANRAVRSESIMLAFANRTMRCADMRVPRFQTATEVRLLRENAGGAP